MTDEQIRIEVAKACGWKIGTIKENSFATPGKVIKHKRWISPLGAAYRTIPDYPNDLNAMHEAEGVLSNPQKRQFATILFRDVLKLRACGGELDVDNWFTHVHATARQRSEAFLRTLGKWIESK